MTLSSVILEKVGEVYKSRSRVVVEGNPLYDFNSIFSGEISSEGIKINILFKDFQNKGEITDFLNDCKSKFSKGYTAFSLKDDFGVSNDYRILKASGGVSKNNVVVYTFNVFPVNSCGVTTDALLSKNSNFVKEELVKAGLDLNTAYIDNCTFAHNMLVGVTKIVVSRQGDNFPDEAFELSGICAKVFPVGRVIGDSVVAYIECNFLETVREALEDKYCVSIHFARAGCKKWRILPEDISKSIFYALSGLSQCCTITFNETAVVVKDYGGYADVFTYPDKKSVLHWHYANEEIDYWVPTHKNDKIKYYKNCRELLMLVEPYKVDRIQSSMLGGHIHECSRILVVRDLKNNEVNMYV